MVLGVGLLYLVKDVLKLVEGDFVLHLLHLYSLVLELQRGVVLTLKILKVLVSGNIKILTGWRRSGSPCAKWHAGPYLQEPVINKDTHFVVATLAGLVIDA